MWQYRMEKGEAEDVLRRCSVGGMNWSVSGKPQAGLQGPEETQAGKRHNSEPASVSSGRR